jgi:hypothetical protein
MSKAGQRDSHVRLGTADMHLQLRRLQQQFATGRTQAQQQFPETHDTTHFCSFTRAARM